MSTTHCPLCHAALEVRWEMEGMLAYNLRLLLKNEQQAVR